jgi:hypothetical protein
MYRVKEDVRSYTFAALSVVAALFLRRLLYSEFVVEVSHADQRPFCNS